MDDNEVQKKGHDMRIGIIGAMQVEVELLRSHMQDATTTDVYGMSFTEGRLGGKDVVLVAGGVGKVNAAMCALTLIERFGVQRIVFTGVAGSLDSKVDILDVVVSTACVHHDYDVSQVFPFEKPVYFEADAALRAAAVRAVAEAVPEVTTYEGIVASGDQFVADAAVKRRIVDTFGALCCEMEGAAVAQVACNCGVPYVVIRAISDKADGSAEVAFDTFVQQAANHSAAVIERLMELL